jgi:hypothetical protein
MRIITALLAMLTIVGLAADVQAADKRGVREVRHLADEVQGKILSRTDSSVQVQANECWLHIEFKDNNVAFDLPLLGTKMTETDLDDGLIIQNRHMTRTFSGRDPEAFDRLLLKFGRHNSSSIKQSFENAIDACGGQQARVANNSRS